MIDGENEHDAIFDRAMSEEAANPELAQVSAPAEADDEAVSPSEALAATVESARADAAQKREGERQAAPPAAEVKFTAEDYLRTRERADALEKRLAEIEKKGTTAEKQAEQKAGLFEDPEGWEAQRKAEIQEAVESAKAELRTQALNHDLDQTRSRVGDKKFAAMDKAVTEAAARDPQFAAQLKALSPYGAGAAIEKWYDSTEIVRDPKGYEARLREKLLAELTGDGAPNGLSAGQKPATGANAAGQNVVKLPPSLSRQSAARAATTADDGDDSEAAIYAAGMNPRRKA